MRVQVTEFVSNNIRASKKPEEARVKLEVFGNVIYYDIVEIPDVIEVLKEAYEEWKPQPQPEIGKIDTTSRDYMNPRRG